MTIFDHILRRRFDSRAYWQARYADGGNSGGGSYGASAAFKANSLNRFIAEHRIDRMLELGSGDGNQAALLEVNAYLGLDISPDAVDIARLRNADLPGRDFRVYDPQLDVVVDASAPLVVSMDVILHLIEPEVYDAYMRTLVACSTRYVGIYSTATEQQPRLMLSHNRYRDHRPWLAEHHPTAREIRVDMVGSAFEIHPDTGFFYYDLRPGD